MNFQRESIFVSTIRVFLSTIACILGIGVAFFLVILGISAASNSMSTTVSTDKSTIKLSPDANWNQTLLHGTAPIILRIDLHGVIGALDLTEKKFLNLLVNSRTGVLKNRVKGILLHVNTPGGTVTDSAGIYRALVAYKEKFQIPIYVMVEGMCASGGMYISSAADKIYSSSDSIIGSVGVRYGPTFNLYETLQKIGATGLTLTEGKGKDFLNPFRPWNEGESVPLQEILADSYEEFVDLVIKARPKISREALINDYGAQIFSSPKAEEIGFVDDGNATYAESLIALTQAAGIKEGESYQVMTIETNRSVFQSLTQDNALLKGKIEHVIPLGPYMTSEMSGKLLYLYQP